MENIAMPTRTPIVNQRQLLKWVTGMICGALLLAWMALGTVMLREPERDYSKTRLSEQGLYSVTIKPDR